MIGRDDSLKHLASDKLESERSLGSIPMGQENMIPAKSRKMDIQWVSSCRPRNVMQQCFGCNESDMEGNKYSLDNFAGIKKLQKKKNVKNEQEESKISGTFDKVEFAIEAWSEGEFEKISKKVKPTISKFSTFLKRIKCILKERTIHDLLTETDDELPEDEEAEEELWAEFEDYLATGSWISRWKMTRSRNRLLRCWYRTHYDKYDAID